MLGKSSMSNEYKIMKFVKCRSDENRDLEDIPFKIYWDNHNAVFKKGEVIKDIALHFQPNKNRWEYELIRDVFNSMKVRSWFDRKLFKEHLPNKYKEKSDTWITRNLGKFEKWGHINKIEHNKYEFVINVIKDID